MKLILFLVFAAVPLLEIALLVKIGQWFGFWWAIGLVVATAIAGTLVLHTQGFAVMRRAVESMNAGKPPIGPAIDGGFLLMAGLLLIMPGVITDTFGLLLLIKPLRHWIAAWSVRRFLRSAHVRTWTYQSTGTRRNAGNSTAEEALRRGPSAGASGNGPGDASQPGTRPSTSAPGEGPVIDGEFERLDERTIDPRRQPRPHDGR